MTSLTAAADTLLDEAETKGRIDVVLDLAARLPMLVLSRVLGVPAEYGHHMVNWTNAITSDDPDHCPDSFYRKRAREDPFIYFRALTAERRKDPQDDLVSVLVGSKWHGRRIRAGEKVVLDGPVARLESNLFNGIKRLPATVRRKG